MKLDTAASWPGGATATCGFVDGLVPPTAGCARQLEQLVELNLGPNPFVRLLMSSNRVWPSLK
jgi:hypothetical protein